MPGTWPKTHKTRIPRHLQPLRQNIPNICLDILPCSDPNLPQFEFGGDVEFEEASINKENLGNKIGSIVADSTAPPKVLIVDDDEALLKLMEKFYLDRGYQPKAVSTAEEALELLFAEEQKFDLVVSDLLLPTKSGMDLMMELKATGQDVPVILITASQSIESAVSALKRGAFDYITKPLNFSELEVISHRAIKHHLLEKDFRQLKAVVQAPKTGLLLGSSPKIRELQILIDRVAASSASILISGESGSGKEMVARAIHSKSPRHQKPFVPVNCSAIPLSLLEAELFGHRKGAFTGAYENRIGLFEEASGGTLFLDEIGDMPMALQTKILRVLQERKVKKVGENEYKPVNVRIIAATNKDLKSAVRRGEFREDLYYRLNVIPLAVPPLRERREDIPILANYFLKKFNLLNDKSIAGFEREAMLKLRRLRWGGNVRELENTIERAVVLSTGPLIKESDINVEGSLEMNGKTSSLFSELLTLRELERQYINYVLEKTNGKKDEASEILGVNRKTLYRKEKEYQLK